MSSLLNKLKGHGHHDQTSTAPNESSNTGYDNTNTSGYGNTTSPTNRSDGGYGNSQNTSSGYDNGPLNSHSDGGRYHAPKGTAVGQGNNTQQGYGESGYGQSGYGNNQSGYNNGQQGYNNTTQGPHSSNLANKADPRVDSDNSRDNHGYGTTTTTTTNTSTSVGHDTYGATHGATQDSNKRLPTDPSHPSMKEKLDPHVETNKTRLQEEQGNTGYGNSTGSNQYGASNKRLPEDPNRPSKLEKANPNVATDSSRRHEQDGYGNTGYGNNVGSNQYEQDSNKRLPKDPNHPSMIEKLNPKVDSDASRRNEYDDAGYGNNSSGTAGPHSSNMANRADPRIDSDRDSRRHGHNDEYAAGGAGAAGAYGATEASRHHGHHHQGVPNDDNTMMNRSHPHTSMHPSDKRYDSNRTDQRTGADGEYLPGPAPTTAGPHKSDMLNKLDPRVDSDQSKLEKEREREGYGGDSRHHHHGTESGYGNTGASPTNYGNEHERRINEGHHDRRHEGIGTGLGQQDQYSSNSPISNRDRDSGYGGQGSQRSNVSTLPQRKPVNESGSYGIDQYNRGSDNDQYGRGGSDYDRSNQAGTFNNPAATTQSTYGNNQSNFGDDENDFECAKCGHKNTHLRKDRNNTGSGYGNENSKPSLKDRMNPKVDANGDGKAGFMK